MTKQEFVANIHAEATSDGMKISKKDTKTIVDKVINGLSESMASGNEILLMPLGRFGTKWRKERKATNLVTGDPLVVKAKYVPNFSPSTELKDKIATLPERS